MQPLATTQMSSKGQVVIPEAIRACLKLQPGDQFVALGKEDVVILKRIAPPAMDAFDQLIQQARTQARQAGLKRADLRAVLKQARNPYASDT